MNNSECRHFDLDEAVLSEKPKLHVPHVLYSANLTSLKTIEAIQEVLNALTMADLQGCFHIWAETQATMSWCDERLLSRRQWKDKLCFCLIIPETFSTFHKMKENQLLTTGTRKITKILLLMEEAKVSVQLQHIIISNYFATKKYNLLEHLFAI